MRTVGMSVLGAILLASLLGPPASADDFKIGVRAGYYTKVEEAFLGGELLIPVAHPFYFNPNVEFVFVENGSYTTFNGDFHYDFPTHGSTYVWLGAGLALARVDPEGPGGSNTDVAVNFLGGVGFRSGPLIPYVQVKVIAKDDSEFALAFGLRF